MLATWTIAVVLLGFGLLQWSGRIRRLGPLDRLYVLGLVGGSGTAVLALTLTLGDPGGTDAGRYAGLLLSVTLLGLAPILMLIEPRWLQPAWRRESARPPRGHEGRGHSAG
ncbi:hypothetical protein [Egibacter rhizosphaerae]|uniref:hypothetical protein n=1 Tax=Egibacter rhizosphaerae TaxID=1670831 RepID=UPI001F114211|nr:hypothetical protein [Egibacter rhizosphaerae]